MSRHRGRTRWVARRPIRAETAARRAVLSPPRQFFRLSGQLAILFHTSTGPQDPYARTSEGSQPVGGWDPSSHRAVVRIGLVLQGQQAGSPGPQVVGLVGGGILALVEA